MSYYDLNSVKQAALSEKIEFRGRKVGRDVANLGYDLSDVVFCLANLSAADFHKTHHYDNGDVDDAYRFEYVRSSGDGNQVDRLYIKFCLMDNYLEIDLGSFHI